MKIEIKETSRSYRMDEDGLFRCNHDRVVIERACCSPFQIGDSGYVECGCHGRDSVYCPDCKDEDLTDSEVDELLN